jgi:hypothetical protein
MATTGGLSTMTVVIVIVTVVLAGIAIALLSGSHVFLALLAACAAIASVVGYVMLRQ